MREYIMIDYTQLAENFGIHVVDTGYMRDRFDASHLLIEKGKALVVDTGTSHSAPLILAHLNNQGLTCDDVLYVVLTHIHLDHAGGAGRLMQLFPKARLLVHPKGVRHMVDPAKLAAAAEAVYGKERFKELYGTIFPIEEKRIIAPQEGYSLDFMGREITILDTPGHARHHICLHDRKSQGVFTGDALGLAYPQLQQGKIPFQICTTSPTAFEPEAMIQSMDKVMALNPLYLYPTHYGPIMACQESVDRAKDMVRAHCQAGENFTEHEQLKEAITTCIADAYMASCGQSLSQEMWQLLADDIELNAQGVAIWWQREQKK